MASRERADAGRECHSQRWSAMEQDRVDETKDGNI